MMMNHETQDTGILEQYTGSLREHIENEYRIEDIYLRSDLKRGLRNADGTGVPVGVTKVGSVMGYMIEDGNLFVWRNDDGEIVATANREDVGKFGKVSSVYTLPQHRRRGYAINLVKGITELLVNDGLIPALYTDGEYSASNECYKKIGYQQVGMLVIVNK
jgi:GNAT superfamily N-acetyltransferase